MQCRNYRQCRGYVAPPSEPRQKAQSCVKGPVFVYQTRIDWKTKDFQIYRSTRLCISKILEYIYCEIHSLFLFYNFK